MDHSGFEALVVSVLQIEIVGTENAIVLLSDFQNDLVLHVLY